MTKVKHIKTWSMYIHHPESSYGTFCYNESGDLFLNSDWGFFAYSWRAFGNDFIEFLSDVDADYVIMKFQINQSSEKKNPIPKHVKEHLKNLFDCFKSHLNDEEARNQDFLEASRDSPEAQHLNNG